MLTLISKRNVWQWLLAVCVLFVTNSCNDKDPYDVCSGYDYAAHDAADDTAIQDYIKSKNYTDVVKTSSGLYYQVLREGTGATPTASQRVKVHYVGKLLPSEYIFDSSWNRGVPATFGVTEVIKGWTEGLQLMHVGERVRLFIPSNLGYGCYGSYPTIPSGAPLVFEVDLLEIL